MSDESKVFHVFDQQTIYEFHQLITAIGKEMNNDNQTWYTVAEAGVYLRCSDRTIHRCMQKGTLRYERMNTGGKSGPIRFHRHWLDAFMMGFNAKRMSPVQKRLLADLYS